MTKTVRRNLCVGFGDTVEITAFPDIKNGKKVEIEPIEDTV